MIDPGSWAALKSGAFGLLPGFGVTLLVLLGVTFLSPKLWIVLTFVCLYSIVSTGWREYRAGVRPDLWRLLRGQAVLVLYVVGFSYLFAFAGIWGILGFVVACLITAVVILYRRRKQYVATLRHIERIIWGKARDEEEHGRSKD